MASMIQKYHAFGVKWVLSPEIVYTKRIALNIIGDIHNRLVTLSRNFDICYTDIVIFMDYIFLKYGFFIYMARIY